MDSKQELPRKTFTETTKTQDRPHDQTDLESVLRRIAHRLQDVDDLIVERLSRVGDVLQFQLVLGEFMRETAAGALMPPSRPDSASSAAEDIAGILLASGIDEDVLDHVAKIKTYTKSYLAPR